MGMEGYRGFCVGYSKVLQVTNLNYKLFFVMMDAAVREVTRFANQNR